MAYNKRITIRILALAITLIILLSSFLSASFTVSGADSDFDQFVVDTVNPSGLNINLFDYWALGTKEDNVSKNLTNMVKSGVNKDHIFQFTFGGNESYSWNANNSAGASQGIVKSTLDSSGFPTLNKDNVIVNGSKSSTISSDESLSYLFDSTEFEGKSAYSGISGLLQVDSDGYYYYDASANYAAYYEDINKFKVYSKPSVKSSKNSANIGQFFPFNTADEVFTIDSAETDGYRSATYADKGYDSSTRLIHSSPWDSSPSMYQGINHYFGMTITSGFVQPTNGMLDGKDMTFSFSGDDDVWVFIDDVLVLDIGGLHGEVSGDINFATGQVQVGTKSGDNYITDGSKNYQDTTLKALYEAAGVNTEAFNGDTFADQGYHTLKMFYLERGNAASNLSLRFNLKVVTQDTLSKYDADGNPIYNAKFKMYNYDDCYDADGNLKDYSTATPLASVSANGTVPILDDNGNRLTLTKGEKYVLIETDAPEGYISLKDKPIITECVDAGADGHGLLQVTKESQLETGAYGSITVTLTTTGANDTDGNAVDLANGTLFAVPMQNIDGEWQAVSGNINLGYSTYGSTPQAALEAYSQQLQLANGGTFGALSVESGSTDSEIAALSEVDEEESATTITTTTTAATTQAVAAISADSYKYVTISDFEDGEIGSNISKEWNGTLSVTEDATYTNPETGSTKALKLTSGNIGYDDKNTAFATFNFDESLLKDSYGFRFWLNGDDTVSGKFLMQYSVTANGTQENYNTNIGAEANGQWVTVLWGEVDLDGLKWYHDGNSNWHNEVQTREFMASLSSLTVKMTSTVSSSVQTFYIDDFQMIYGSDAETETTTTTTTTTTTVTEPEPEETEPTSSTEPTEAPVQSSVYSASLHQLPGAYDEYCWEDNHTDTCTGEYRMGYYFVDTNGNVQEVSLNNIEKVFNTELYIPNIKKEFSVKKVEAIKDGDSYTNGTTVLSNASFTLYKVSDTPDGVIDGLTATEYCSGTTASDGLISFPTDGKVLTNGTYYLEETFAPVGYALNENKIVVVVDDTGAFIYTGTDDDLVDVSIQPMKLVATMHQYAANSDGELNKVTVSYKTADVEDGTAFDEITNWNNTDTCNLIYNTEAANGTYLKEDGAVHNHSVSSGYVTYDITNTNGDNLNNIYKKETVISVGDIPGATGTLQIYEFLSGVDKDILAEKEIEMTLTFHSSNPDFEGFTFNWKKYVNPKSSSISEEALEEVIDSDGNAEEGAQTLTFTEGVATWTFSLKCYEFIELTDVTAGLTYSITQTLDDGYKGDGTNSGYKASYTPMWKGRNNIYSSKLKDVNTDGSLVDKRTENKTIVNDVSTSGSTYYSYYNGTYLNETYPIENDKIVNAVMYNRFSRALTFYKVDGITKTALQNVRFKAYPAKSGTNYYDAETDTWAEESLTLATLTIGSENSFKSNYFSTYEASDSYSRNFMSPIGSTTTSKGYVNLAGLAAGCYRLVEVYNNNTYYEVPEGQWNLYVPEDLTQPIVIKAINTNSDGTTVSLPPAFNLSGDVYASDGTTIAEDTMTLPNFTDVTPPITGGRGIKWFFLFGGLVLFAGLSTLGIYMVKCRKNGFSCFGHGKSSYYKKII